MMLTGLCTGAASDTAVIIINHLVNAHYAKIVKVGLYTVVRTSGNSYLDMIVRRENQLLNLSCQLISIHIAFDTMSVTNTGHNVTGTNGRISALRIILCVLMSDGFHIHTAHLHINILNIFLNLLVAGFNVLILNARNIESLTSTHVECSVSIGLTQLLNQGQMFCIDQTAGNAQLKHEFSGNL